MIRHRHIAARALCLVSLFSFHVSSVSAAAKPIAFTGPDVVKLDWGTRSLCVGDLNGDGLPDIAVANNDRATIEILYQLKPGEPPPRVPAALSANRWEPVVEDARFRKASITTGAAMFELAIGDLNGDGLPDFAYTGAPQNLALRIQQPDGSWLEKKIAEAPVPNQLAGSLKIADLDGNGRADIAMLGDKELAVFHQNADGTLASPQRYTLPDDNCYGLEVCDVNGDGLPDLLYLCNGPRQTVRVRLQMPGGRQFGPELSYEIKPSRCTLQILRQADAAQNRHATFAFAQDGAGQLEEFTLRPAETGDAAANARPLPLLNPRTFSPRPGAKTPAAHALGRFTKNKNAAPDVVISDPDAAQVSLYARQPDGSFTSSQKSPVFSDARAIAAGDWHGDGLDALFVASPKEQTVGVSRYIDGRFEYPKPLPVTGRPLAIAFGDFNGHGRKLLAILVENKGSRAIELWARKGDAAECVKTIDVANLKTDPRALRLIDANQDGLLDIAVFTPLDSMRLYVQTPAGELDFTEVSASGDFRRGLVDNLESSAVTSGDIDGDGKPELLTASTGFARALRLDGGGLQVVDQFNARAPDAEIAAAFAIPDAAAAPGAKATIVLYDRKAEQFQLLRPDASGLYQIADTTPAGKIDVTGVEVLPASNEAFIFGRDRFWWLPLGQRDLSAVTLSTHTTDLPNTGYYDIIAGDLDNDGQPEIVCVDPMKNLLEILRRSPDGARWDSVMHFKVFEVDQHYQGRRGSTIEPRETVIANLTGDPKGKKSLLLLVHDRILIYPQQQ